MSSHCLNQRWLADFGCHHRKGHEDIKDIDIINTMKMSSGSLKLYVNFWLSVIIVTKIGRNHFRTFLFDHFLTLKISSMSPKFSMSILDHQTLFLPSLVQLPRKLFYLNTNSYLVTLKISSRSPKNSISILSSSIYFCIKFGGNNCVTFLFDH